MPIVVGSTTSPPPPTPPPAFPRPPDPGVWRPVWIPPGTDVEVPLNDDGTSHFTLDAVAGWGAAPIRLVTDPHPRGGARVRHIQPQPREIDWPVRMRADTHMELITGYRDLVSKFTITRRLGPGRLRIYRPDGSAREIEAYYQDGFGGTPGQGWLYETSIVSLFCEDPYWRDINPVEVPREYGVGVPFLSPFPTVSSSIVLGETEVFNPGEVEAWPSWVITGPATGLIATNQTTGESFELTYDLDPGDTITITTDPPTVRGPSGEVLTSALNWPDAVLWALQPGLNSVDFDVSGANTGTSIVLSYYPRHETA